MTKMLNKIGEKYGKLTIESLHHREGSSTYFNCRCECGALVVREYNGLRKTQRRGQISACPDCRAKLNTQRWTEATRKGNRYELYDTYGIGYTSTGVAFYFDIDDYERVSKFCWRESRGYIRSVFFGKSFSLHRHVLGYTGSLDVDHINGNRADCRKSNLRICTHAQNTANQKVNCTNRSGYKGVYFRPNCGKYAVQLVVNGKTIYGGLYKDIKEAIAKRAELEKQYQFEYRYIGGTVNV